MDLNDTKGTGSTSTGGASKPKPKPKKKSTKSSNGERPESTGSKRNRKDGTSEAEQLLKKRRIQVEIKIEPNAVYSYKELDRHAKGQVRFARFTDASWNVTN